MAPRDRSIRIVRLGDNDDKALFATTTAGERLEMMWPLALDAWAMKGEPVDELRLPRHVVHIQRYRR